MPQRCVSRFEPHIICGLGGEGEVARTAAIRLPADPFSLMLRDMEVHFDPNLEERLTRRATQHGRKPDDFVQDVVARYLDDEDRLVEAVKRGEDALQRGEYLTHQQVHERLRRYLEP